MGFVLDGRARGDCDWRRPCGLHGLRGRLHRVVARYDLTPAYIQIADELRQEIGLMGEGERLPSETVLVRRFGVARMTVRQAIRVLRDEGLVEAEQGRGVFVRPVPPGAHLTDEQLLAEVKRRGLELPSGRLAE